MRHTPFILLANHCLLQVPVNKYVVPVPNTWPSPNDTKSIIRSNVFINSICLPPVLNISVQYELTISNGNISAEALSKMVNKSPINI